MPRKVVWSGVWIAWVLLGLLRVWTYQDLSQAGYALSAAESERRDLLEQRRVLQVEWESLRSPLRLEQLARDLQLQQASPHSVLAAPWREMGGAHE